MQLKFKARINRHIKLDEDDCLSKRNYLVEGKTYPVRTIYLENKDIVIEFYCEQTDEKEIVVVAPEDVDFTLYQLINEEWIQVTL